MHNLYYGNKTIKDLNKDEIINNSVKCLEKDILDNYLNSDNFNDDELNKLKIKIKTILLKNKKNREENINLFFKENNINKKTYNIYLIHKMLIFEIPLTIDNINIFQSKPASLKSIKILEILKENKIDITLENYNKVEVFNEFLSTNKINYPFNLENRDAEELIKEIEEIKERYKILRETFLNRRKSFLNFITNNREKENKEYLYYSKEAEEDEIINLSL